MCLIFSTACGTFIILRKIERGIIVDVHTFSCRVPRYSCHISMKLEFSRDILEQIFKMSNYIKIRPIGTELFHADRQSDMTKLIVAFRNFANTPSSVKVLNGCSPVRINTTCFLSLPFKFPTQPRERALNCDLFNRSL